jgi:hypothetical protein
MLWNFYVAQYKDEEKWKEHVTKHIRRLKRIVQETIPVPEDIAYRDINLTLLFGGKPVLVVFEPSDYKKKFVLYNPQTGWMLILLAAQDERTILTSFYLTQADTPEAYFKEVKGYDEIAPSIPDEKIKEVADEKQGYYRKPTKEEEEFLCQLRSQCRFVGC